MGAKIFTLPLLALFLCVGTSFAQTNDAMKKEQEKYIQKQLEDYNKRIDSYINLLKVDDFQGTIIKQKIDEFYKNRHQILMSEVSEFEKEPLVEQLKTNLFTDVKELYTEEIMMSVQRFLTDNKAEVKRLQKNLKNN